MNNEVTLNVISEPQDHFTVDDDHYLKSLISDKRKGPLAVSVIIKDDMKQICSEVMAHWYNIKENDNTNYEKRFFDEKWKVLDNRHQGQIEYEEAQKFVRDYIGGMIQI